MAHYLMLAQSAPHWRLATSEDPATLPGRLTAGIGQTEPVTVRVVLADQLQETELHVRPDLLAWWTVVELPDSDR